MKKLLSLMLLLMAAVMTTATFTACGDDDDDNNTSTVAGSYTGKDKVTIGGKWSYSSSAVYIVTANGDGTINLTVGEEKFEKTIIGDITQGTFTIKNIPYDAKTSSYTKDYKADQIYAHVKSPTMDDDYLLSSGAISVTPQADGGIKVVNSQYTYGTSMPYKIDAEFTGTRK